LYRFLAIAVLLDVETYLKSDHFVGGESVWWSIEAGVHVEPHRHANEQIVWMLKGKMEFRLGTEQRVCGPGDVVVTR
jgi:quercetin dioxygenase-like cupin family protein